MPRPRCRRPSCAGSARSRGPERSICIRRRSAPHLARGRPENRRPFEQDLAAVGSMRRKIRRPVVDLPHPTRPPARGSRPGGGESHAVDGVDLPDGSPEKAALDGEILLQAAHLEQFGMGMPGYLRSVQASSGRWCAVVATTLSGGSARQTRIEDPVQRGWKVHPAAGRGDPAPRPGSPGAALAARACRCAGSTPAVRV